MQLNNKDCSFPSWFLCLAGGHFQTVQVKLGTGTSFEAILCFFTEVELAYFKNGGILQYVLRQMLAK